MPHPDLVQSFLTLLVAARDFLTALVGGMVPWTPLAAWAAFWLLAVDWSKLHPVIVKKGGMVGLICLWFLTVMVWSVIAPPANGVHDLLGLKVGSFAGKAVYTSVLYLIVCSCASAQLAGICNCCVTFEEPAAEDDHHASPDHSHNSTGHDSHGSVHVADHH